MQKYFSAKRSDSNARKLLAIFLNIAGYVVIVTPFLLILNEAITK